MGHITGNACSPTVIIEDTKNYNYLNTDSVSGRKTFLKFPHNTIIEARKAVHPLILSILRDKRADDKMVLLLSLLLLRLPL